MPGNNTSPERHGVPELFGCGCPYGDPIATGLPHRDRCPKVRPYHVPGPVTTQWVTAGVSAFVAGASRRAREGGLDMSGHAVFQRTAMDRAARAKRLEDVALVLIKDAVLSQSVASLPEGWVDYAIAEVIDVIDELCDGSAGSVDQATLVQRLAAQVAHIVREVLSTALQTALPASAGRVAVGPAELAARRREVLEAIPAAAAEVVRRWAVP